MNEFKYVDYEVADAVATITLARPEKANAQNERMLDEVDHRFRTAEYDDEVKVIVLRGEGKHFSAGHDLGVRAIPKGRDSKKKTAVGSCTRSIAGRRASIWATRGIGATSLNPPSVRSREKRSPELSTLFSPLTCS